MDISSAEFGIRPTPIPGWKTFERNYSRVEHMKADKILFVTHDLRNAASPLLTAYKRYFDRKDPAQLDAVIRASDQEKKSETVEDSIAAVENALAQNYGKELTGKDPDMAVYFQNYFDRKLPALRAMYPILKSSTLFLDAPTEAKFKELVSREIDLSTVVALATGEDPRYVPEAKLNGAEAVVAFNLLHNANRYGNPGSVMASVDRGDKPAIEIRNLSEHPVPPRPFSFGKKGSRSPGIGAGLFISKHLYAPLAQFDVKAYDNGLDVESLSEPAQGAPEGPAHKIQFFMVHKPHVPESKAK